MNYYLKQKGWSNLAIAEAVGCHRDNADAISVLAIPRSSTEHSLTPPYNATNTTAASAATAPTVCSRFNRSLSTSRASSTVVPG